MTGWCRGCCTVWRGWGTIQKLPCWGYLSRDIWTSTWHWWDLGWICWLLSWVLTSLLWVRSCETITIRTFNDRVMFPTSFLYSEKLRYVWNISYIELQMWNQVSYDPRSYEHNLCNYVSRSLKNWGLQQGLNPWPRDTSATLSPIELWGHWLDFFILFSVIFWSGE